MATEVEGIAAVEGDIVTATESDSDGATEKKRGWLRRRFKKDGEKEKSRKPPG